MSGKSVASGIYEEFSQTHIIKKQTPQLKNCQKFNEIPHQRTHMDDKYVHKKMLSIIYHKSTTRYPQLTFGIANKTKQKHWQLIIPSAGEDVEQLELSHIATNFAK